MWPKRFFLNLCATFTVEKCSQKIWAINANFIKVTKGNNDLIGDNSTNLVTLFTTDDSSQRETEAVKAYLFDRKPWSPGALNEPRR
jgi:hypothetical protein